MPDKLFRIHGGLHLQAHKSASTNHALQDAGLPERLYLPLKQHIGDYPEPLVAPGDRVLKGQMIAAPATNISAPVHASSSGMVSLVATHPVAHPSGQSDRCIIIDVDGKDDAIEYRSVDISHASPAQLIELLRNAGIAGLGGAVFPTAAKLLRAGHTGIKTLIINGVECEPYISCDDMLMRHRSAEVLRGIEILQQILAPAKTLIGIEDNKPEAFQAMSAALQERSLVGTRLISIPTIYPSGGEKQLIQILTGDEIPQGQLALDIGYLCQNVGTCAAIARAIDTGEPLISRVVTVSGDNILHPGNWDVRLGTAINHLIALAGGYKQADNRKILMGGPMMGFPLASTDIPIVKASNNILVMHKSDQLQGSSQHDECIRCADCTEVCPANLLPQQLYWQVRAKAFDKAADYHLFDCIECGCCTEVCPSDIPLVHYYRSAKAEIRVAALEQVKSDRARVRFEFREQRLLLKKQQEEERRRLKRLALKNRKPGTDAKDSASCPVQAALERVKARKLAQQDKNETKLDTTDAPG
ncbi:MAG: electron transport complex protein RnfC [Planctomycetota bacterium]|jgi:electron transport complex protein RnfC